MTGLDPAVQVAAITGAFGLLAALVGVLAEALRRQGKAIDEVRDHAHTVVNEVSNDHRTNLRDDVDRVLDGLRRVLDGQARHDTALRQHGAEIGGLRRELGQERVERLAVAERVDHLYMTRDP